MEELHATADDQSHYEISLTAGQAFAAFVLLLLSLAAVAAFAWATRGGQFDDLMTPAMRALHDPANLRASAVEKKP